MKERRAPRNFPYSNRARLGSFVPSRKLGWNTDPHDIGNETITREEYEKRYG